MNRINAEEWVDKIIADYKKFGEALFHPMAVVIAAD